jgi:alpha-mannosidase
MLHGKVNDADTALAIVHNGQYGLDYKDGEVRLSVLRSAAYCHEQAFPLGESVYRKYMDQGVHDVQLLVTAGNPDAIMKSLSGLADWLSAPPVVYAHLPLGSLRKLSQTSSQTHVTAREFLSVNPENIRLAACKQSWDGKALILRLQETAGIKARAVVSFKNPHIKIRLSFKPFEIKTVRVGKTGKWKEVDLIEER